MAALWVVVVLGGVPAGAASPAGFLVSVSETPSSSNPLLVSFTATVVPGTPTALNWSFGDGTVWNGSGPGSLTPSHLYPRGGGFNVSVVVHEGAAVQAQWLIIQLSSPLVVTVGATNATGSAPLTVSFNASASGGTGTYRSFFWDFGDGGSGSGLSIRYTYGHAGHFVATLNVTDSSGKWVRHGLNISVLAGPSSGSTPEVTPLSLGLWAVAGAGLGAMASAAVILLGLRRHLSRRGAAPAPGVPAEPAGLALAVAPALAPPMPPTLTPEPPAAVPRAAEPEPPMAVGRAPAPTGEALRLSQRIVLHLASQGSLDEHEVATLAFTQLGMASTLSVRQNRLTSVLRRLVAAGVLTEDVRHVRGHPRRLKVYRLAPRGEALARDLRHR